MEIFEKDTFTRSGGCVLVFGNFDGVHLGHQYLMNTAKKYAAENRLRFGVYTFIDSPKFRNPDHSLLTDLQTRLSFIDSYCSPDFVYLERFDDVKNLSPTEFVDYVIDIFSCECGFSGENFCFGKGAEGNSAELARLMQEKGKNAYTVESVMSDNVTVSSSYIKTLLSEGKVEKAAELLGEPYGFCSKVVHGAHLGHSLGFPTINQIIPKALTKPRYGVYSTVVIIDGREYMGVTNFGVKPTVSQDAERPVAETYIIDFDGDVYDKYVTVLFCKMLREERKFSSVDELKKNIELNVEQTKEFFGKKYKNI